IDSGGTLQGDLLGNIVSQSDERLALDNWSAFAANFDNRSQFLGQVDINGDPSFRRLALFSLSSNGGVLFAKDFDGLFHIPVRFCQCGLAMHHWGAVFLPEPHHVCRGKIAHRLNSTLNTLHWRSAKKFAGAFFLDDYSNLADRGSSSGGHRA